MHTYDPFVLLHVASLWHLPMNASHLSVVKFTLASKKSSKLEFICQSLYDFILRESHNDINSRTSNTRNKNYFERGDKEIKQNAT